MLVPLQDARFSLDVSGIAGFFGGEESFAAMSSVHLIRGRRFFGWYNSPGSYFVAKKYGTLCHRRIWKGLFPGETVDPEEMLGLDGRIGPQYIGTQSGTTMHATGHLAYLLAQHCKHLDESEQKSKTKLTIFKFDESHCESVANFLESQPSKGLPVSSLSNAGILLMSITISISIAAAIVAATLWHDWPCFVAIFIGIFCNGVSCLVLGSGQLKLDVPLPSPNSPPGDGIFWYDAQNQAVLVKGASEQVVSVLTRGKFQLVYSPDKDYDSIGVVAFALTVQVLAQLFLLPQATLVGQILFLFTFAVSWAYNAYLASMDREKMQIDLLLNILANPKPLIPTSRTRRTTAVVASAFYLKPFNVLGYINILLPNDTSVWTPWKEHIAKCVQDEIDPTANENAVTRQIEHQQKLTEQQKALLRDLLKAAGEGYVQWATSEKEKLGNRASTHSTLLSQDSGHPATPSSKKDGAKQRVTRVSTLSRPTSGTLFEQSDARYASSESVESYA